MKIGIMQPYFFPYIGYFQLINYVDKWIAFDDVQYINHGWINRNRILHPNKGWQYIIMPLKKHLHTDKIKDIEVIDEYEWKEKILRQLEHYKKKATNYFGTIEIVNRALNNTDKCISKFNVNLIKEICSYLDIHTEISISSSYNFDYSNVNDSGEWALRISEQMNAQEYINPYGGIELFNKKKFIESNIKLKFMKPRQIIYNQKKIKFESDLSVIDVMMFNDREKIIEMLNEYEVLEK